MTFGGSFRWCHSHVAWLGGRSMPAARAPSRGSAFRQASMRHRFDPMSAFVFLLVAAFLAAAAITTGGGSQESSDASGAAASTTPIEAPADPWTEPVAGSADGAALPQPADATPAPAPGPDRTADNYYYSDESGDYSTPADGDYNNDGVDDCQATADMYGPDDVDWELCD